LTAARATILLLLVAEGCANLPEIPPGTCGNHVVEPHEDCDGFALALTFACLPPGAVGQCHFDCARRADGLRPSCPAGWGCNSQDICRPPTGDFDAPSSSKVGGAWSLMAGDLDGDGRAEVMTLERPDMLGGTKARFHYFDAAGLLAETRTFSKNIASPVIVPHPGADQSDLVFIDTRRSIGVLLGQSDRSLVPEAFSSYRFPDAAVRLLAVADAPIGNNSAIVILTSIDGVPGFYVPDAVGNLRHAGQLPGPVEALVGEPASGDVIEDLATSPCHELILAVRGAKSFYLVDLCTRQGATTVYRDEVIETRVDLDPPSVIDMAPTLVDVNGDGHLDVLIGAGGGTYVAIGDGHGLAKGVPFQVQLATPGDLPHDIPMPLAVADFTGDGVVDFVFGDGLLLSASGSAAAPLYRPGQRNQAAPWTVARVADLNANGKLDVIAASNGRLGIDFFNGTGTADLHEFNISTDGPVQFLVVADLDGDLINDLAFIEPGTSETERDSVLIAFGNSAGPPLAPVPVARVGHVEDFSVVVESGLGNLIVASTETVAGGKSGALALLNSRSDRLPAASYDLVDTSKMAGVVRALAGAVTVGGFITAGHADLMVLGVYGNAELNAFQFWLLPPLETSEGAVLSVGGGIDPRLTPLYSLGSEIVLSLASTAADVDGDGRDEALWVMPADANTHCGVVVTGTPTVGATEVMTRETLVIDEPCLAPQLAPVDADGDGRVDLALLTGTPGETGRKLLVLWNDGAGGFVNLSPATVNAVADSPGQFSVMPATPSHPPIFVYVTEHAAFQVTPTSPGAREFAPPQALADLQRGTGIVAADLNGDGVVDLALADSGNLVLLKAKLAAP
jgi:FG-GAP-like repeat